MSIETQEREVADHPGIMEHPDIGIELPDGTRLSARRWRPADQGDTPLPAIVEYLPYRKSDGTAARDRTMHPHFAAHGYVCLRVDRRGCGDSEGLFDDEYSEQEIQDGVDLLAWITTQPWCNGRIGMQGISWGGFNSLQIAARRPPGLQAIISLGSSVDRFADDIHYKGGIQLGENVGWAATSMSWFSMPPDPAIVGERWRAIWLERLAHTPFLVRDWLHHANRDAYWQHGSVCEDYAAIEAPVLALGGQHDGYRNTVSHLIAHLDAPVKGLLGPWGHKYPHISTIGPCIDYVALALAWWDHWLKDVDNDVPAWPALCAYVMTSRVPDPCLDHRDGQWVAEEDWPLPEQQTRMLDLGPGTLGAECGCDVRIETDLAIGRNGGEYFPFGFGSGELPEDQRDDDALSACFDSATLAEDWTLLGAPTLHVRLAADTHRAQLIARLCDVRPDGSVMLIGLGLLNLRHRNGFDRADDLVPGETIDVRVDIDQIAYRLPAGHRLRLALSNSYWPYCWPEGLLTCLTVTGGTLSLPCRYPLASAEASTDRDTRDSSTDATTPACGWPASRTPPSMTGLQAPSLPAADRLRTLRAPADRKDRVADPATGLLTLTITADHGRQEDPDTGLITESSMSEAWQTCRHNPASARVTMIWNRALARGDWGVSTRVTTHMQGREHDFRVTQRLEAFEQDQPVFSRLFETTIAR